ncbi:hypothetical protein GCM10007103_26370 [Salinimicrobium marinum]|uniref:Uncharacterized protein n=1 Tax=Salinimicrobium marinum TaxID=680283 RepID=A0A918SIE8_9FLAO|nr:hypothetical protein [Salinimicrobium marinum]GHA43887.1 hypothetical protein GCM10007103_26370 [Salinimicrobium marinum]
MKITVIAPYTFGYIDVLVDKIAEGSNVTVEFIDISTIKFEYTSVLQRGKNFLLKNLLNRNLKREHRMRVLSNRLSQNPEQDVILVVRPDVLDEPVLAFLRTRAKKVISYYYDSINNIPEKQNLLAYFDEVYSFEKADVKKFGLKFITNFIPVDEPDNFANEKGVFHISSYDSRSKIIVDVARQLEKFEYPYNFVVKSGKALDSKYLKVITEYVDCKEVLQLMKRSDVILDVQKEHQEGLSFRVFEALGFDKKLITTNEDVRNYDFYNPENILIVDRENPVVIKSFLRNEYVPVPKSIKDKYRRDAWIQEVLGI